MLPATIGLASLDDFELAATFAGEEAPWGIPLPPMFMWGVKVVEFLISNPPPEASYAYAKVGWS